MVIFFYVPKQVIMREEPVFSEEHLEEADQTMFNWGW